MPTHRDGRVDPLVVGDEDSVAARVAASLPTVTDVRTVEDLETALSDLAETDRDCLLVADDSAVSASAALERVRDDYPDLPVFVVVDDDEAAAAALEAGATDYISADLVDEHGVVPRRRVEDAVTQSVDGAAADSRYRHLIEHSTDIITVVGSDGTIQYHSPAAERLLGYDPEELVGEFVFNYVHPDDRDAVRETFIDLMGRDETATEEVTYRFEHADGSWVWLETTGSNQKHTAVGGYVFNSRDVTERKERERELAREQDLLGTSLDTLNDVFYLVDADGGLQRWNDRFEAVTGYSATELAEMDALDFFEGAGRERIAAAIAETLETGSATVEAEFVTSDGERIPYEFTGARLGDAEDVDGLVGIGRDISERKARERQLERYETLVRAIPDEVYTMDEDGYHTSVVPPTGRDRTVAGYDPAELVGEHASMVMDEDDIARAREAIRELVVDEDRERTSFEMDLITADGERVPHENHVATLPSADGEFRGTVGVLRDISERKEREEVLEQYETVVENAQDGTFLVDVADHGRFEVVRVNPAYESMSNLGQADVEGKTLREVFGDEVGRHVEAKFRECVDHQTDLEFESTVEISGVPKHWYSHIAPVVVDGEVERIVGSTRDVTERRERERELRLKDRVMSEAPVGIAIADATRPNTPVVYANDGFQAVTGYDETDVRGRPLPFLAGPETDSGKLSTLRTAIDRRETVAVELLLYRQDGTPSWTRVSVAPVRDDDEVTHVVGFLEDVTEQKEYEQWIERQFDEFSDVIAEDLGEPIERARSRLAASGADDEDVESAREWLDRAGDLIDDLTTVHSFEVKPREVSEATRRGSRADE